MRQVEYSAPVHNVKLVRKDDSHIANGHNILYDATFLVHRFRHEYNHQGIAGKVAENIPFRWQDQDAGYVFFG